MTLSVSELREKFHQPGPTELELIARYAMLPEDPQRARAFEAFAASGLPHRRQEAWKWSDFRRALPTLAATQQDRALSPSIFPDSIEIKLSAQGFQLPDQLPEGVKLHLRSAPQALADAEDAPLASLTAALAGRVGGPDMLIIEVTGKVDHPLHILCQGDQDETNFARIAVVVRPEASLNLWESHLGGAGFSSYLIEADLHPGAEFHRTVFQRGRADEVQAATALVNLNAAANYTQTQLAFGAKLARLETRLRHQATGSQATLNGAYLCADTYHVDMTSHVRHGAPSCVTRQIIKGAVLNGGTGVFQGKFHVPRTIGQFTDADMQHQALLLEEGAVVFAKPELEIYADDVECAHGNTSGALDESQLFYMRQRGISLQEARALLTEAFIAEAFEAREDDIQSALRHAAQAFLSGGQ